MHRVLLALVLVFAATPAPAAHDALTAIDGCLGQLDPSLDVGYGKIAARCPELAPALEASPWAAWLPRDWDTRRNDLSDQGLTELKTLILRESQRRGQMRAPRTERVGAVLAALEAPRPVGWWARLKAWLRGILEARDQADQGNWLTRLLGSAQVSERLRRLILIATCAVLAGLASGVVINELRLAGLLRVRGQRRAGRADEAGGPLAGARDLAQVEAAAAELRPRLLLELIARRLYEAGRLPPARALTVQELLQSARLMDGADRERLRLLARVSERLRFSGRTPAPEALDAALERGRELLAGLAASHA